MISVLVGPASTWQWVQVWLHSLPTLTCRVSMRSARRVSCPYSASVPSNERRTLAVFFSGLRRTVTLAMSTAASTRCAGDGLACDCLGRPVDDCEVPAVQAGLQYVQRLRADLQRDAPPIDMMVVVLRFHEGPGEEGEVAFPDTGRLGGQDRDEALIGRGKGGRRIRQEKEPLERRSLEQLSGAGHHRLGLAAMIGLPQFIHRPAERAQQRHEPDPV